MTIQQAATPNKENRIANGKMLYLLPASFYGQANFNSCLSVANGWIFWASEQFILASQDGVTFFDTGFVPGGQKIRTIAYGAGKYVGVGPEAFIISSDGPDRAMHWNWEEQSPPGEFAGTYFDIIFTDGHFMACGGSNEDPSLSVPIIHRSANGSLWLDCTIDVAYDQGILSAIVAGGGNIVACGSYYDTGESAQFGAIVLSTGAIEDFELQEFPYPQVAIGFDIIYTGTHFLCAGVKYVDETFDSVSLLIMSETGSEWEEISDKSYVASELQLTYPLGLVAPSSISLLQHGSDIFYLHPNSMLEISRIGSDGIPGNFKLVPLENEPYKSQGMIALGENFYLAPLLGLFASQPYIPVRYTLPELLPIPEEIIMV
jgi:hypothetical protein